MTSFVAPPAHGSARAAEYEREENRKAAKRAHAKSHPRERSKRFRRFAGFDGEGWAGPGGHNLYILRAGGHELYTGRPLGAMQVFAWMVNLPREPLYVGFALGYDLTMILRGLPRERFDKLYARESRTVGERMMTLPVDWGPYRLDWIPGKRFSVHLAEDRSKRFDVEDCLGCFQQSFVTAVKAWKVASDDDLAIFEDMKAKRSRFHEVAAEPGGLDRIRDYNDRECIVLARMMERVRDACVAQEIHPTSWYGAGQLAQALLRKHDAKSFASKFPDAPTFMRKAADAYYGGFFDTSEVGIYPRIWEYDIASAYPHAMRNLPCLAHASLQRGFSAFSGSRSLYRVRWKPAGPGEPSWGAFPLRHSRREKALRSEPATFYEAMATKSFTPGTLYYPLHGEGWYWDREVEAVMSRGGFNVEILDAFSLERSCDCEPYGWIPELYEYRKALGKSGQGMVLKLGLNSLYGKLAQHIGRPQFANPILAGMITAQTRAMIHRAIGLAGEENIVMVATDAVYSKVPIEGLDLGDGLGQWEAKEFGKYMVILPGLHYAGDSSKVKTRGIPARVIREGLARIEAHWYSPQRWEPIRFPLEAFISCQNAYHIGRGDWAGQWMQVPRSIHFGSADKRILPLDEFGGDAVKLPLWGNLLHIPSGHRSEWDYSVAVRKRQEASQGYPEVESLGDAQPDWFDLTAVPGAEGLG
jgi:hypothetical protein